MKIRLDVLGIIGGIATILGGGIWLGTLSQRVTSMDPTKVRKEYENAIADLKEASKEFREGLPVGTIVAWHKNAEDVNGANIELNLPDGWEECNGKTILDSESSLNGMKLPDLNGKKLFLRGNDISGKFQTQSWKTLRMKSEHGNNYSHNEQKIPKYEWMDSAIYGGTWGAAGYLGNRLSFKYNSEEIRPANFSVVWIVKVK